MSDKGLFLCPQCKKTSIHEVNNWAHKKPDDTEKLCAKCKVVLTRVEHGFVVCFVCRNIVTNLGPTSFDSKYFDQEVVEQLNGSSTHPYVSSMPICGDCCKKGQIYAIMQAYQNSKNNLNFDATANALARMVLTGYPDVARPLVDRCIEVLEEERSLKNG